MAKGSEIKTIVMVPMPDGAYRDFQSLTAEQKKHVGDWAAETMGNAFNACAGGHPEQYAEI